MEGKRFKISKIVTLASCFCLILTALIAAFVNKGYVQSIRELVRSTTKSNIGELTVSKSEYLDEKIRFELLSLQSLSTSISANGPELFHEDLIREYHEIHKTTNIWIMDTSGTQWGLRSKGEGGAFPEEEALYEPALRGETCVSDVFIGAMGRRHVLMQTPLYKNGQVVGGLYEACSIEMLQNTYGESTYNDAGYSYVLSDDGSIVVSPVRFSSLQIYSNFKQLLEGSGNSPEAVSAFMEAIQTGSKGTATFDLEGEAQFLSFVPLEEKVGWYFVTVIPLNMVEKDGTRIVAMTVRMAIVIIGAVIITLSLAISMIYLGTKRRLEADLYIRNIYQAIAQNIDTVIFIVDGKTSNVEYVFENAQQVLGISAEEFSSPGVGEAGGFQDALQEWLRDERPLEKTQWERSFFNNTKGTYVWLKLTALPVTLRGEPKYIFSATDITRYRKIEENLNAAVAAAEQANAAKSLFLSNMSHDIRTPMNAIVGMTKLAEIHIGNQAKVEDCLRKIGVSSKHLLGLINDVLDMSKIESGKMTLAAENFSLPELIESDLAIVQPQCRAKSQTFTVKTKNIRHEMLEGDSLRLNQVFLNLTSNAVKFTPEQGSILFSIEELPQRHREYAAYRFQVSDSGIGITPEYLPNLFTPFIRESTKTVNKTEGTGLGLAISKNIVDAMGGQLLVESEEGKGTVFTVELEFRLPSDTEDELDGAESLVGLHALLAGDVQGELETINTYLTELGMETDSVRSAEEMDGAAGKGVFYDFVLTDWEMWGKDSIEMVRRIRADIRDTRIVLVSPYDSELIERETTEQPVEAVLLKPVFKSVLCKTLIRLLSVGEERTTGPKPQEVLAGRRFLLVEDNEINREIAVQLFELAGAAVETAEDGQKGAEAFESAPHGYFDVIFMDIQMPVMDGLEATKCIRASHHPQAQAIPIVAMSANVFAEDVRASKNAGMNAHTGKPIDMDEICRILQEVLPKREGI